MLCHEGQLDHPVSTFSFAPKEVVQMFSPEMPPGLTILGLPPVTGPSHYKYLNVEKVSWDPGEWRKMSVCDKKWSLSQAMSRTDNMFQELFDKKQCSWCETNHQFSIVCVCLFVTFYPHHQFNRAERHRHKAGRREHPKLYSGLQIQSRP